jgi:hypothetical protein
MILLISEKMDTIKTALSRIVTKLINMANFTPLIN